MMKMIIYTAFAIGLLSLSVGCGGNSGSGPATQKGGVQMTAPVGALDPPAMGGGKK